MRSWNYPRAKRSTKQSQLSLTPGDPAMVKIEQHQPSVPLELASHQLTVYD